MNKKQLKQWFTERGYSFSYSGHTKTLYLHNYSPENNVELPAEDLYGVSIVGLQKHKLK